MLQFVIFAVLGASVAFADLNLLLEKECVQPGVCVPPRPSDYKYVAGRDAIPRVQWGSEGGFCGAVSIQTIALTYGYWVSQDLVRKATPDNGQGGHGNPDDGYEVLHSNIEDTLDNLGITYNSWDWENEVHPQGQNYLAWLKSELLSDHGVVQFVLCKGDAHSCYDGSKYDHIEPFFKLYTNHELTDYAVYADDVVVHASDYGPDGRMNLGYFRNFSSLLDDTTMEGNCKDAQPGWGYNEMYPCIYEDTSYGYAITGLVDANSDQTLPLALYVNSTEEPNIRLHQLPSLLQGQIVVSGLSKGSDYVVYRWDDYTTFPRDGNYEDSKYTSKFQFTATNDSYEYFDEQLFLSSGSVLYRCVKK